MKVAFYKGKGDYTDIAIRTWTWGPYSHSELVFQDNFWFSSSYRDGGVRFKQINAKKENWDYIELSNNSHEDTNIRKWCEEQKGSYDLFGVFSFIFPVLGQTKEKWFCSEICLAALQTIGILPEWKPYKVSPNKLYSLLKSK